MTRIRRWVAAGIVSSLVLGVACSGGDDPDLSRPSDAPSSSRDSDGTDTDDRDSSDDTDTSDGDASEALEDETFHVAESLGDDLVVRSAASTGAEEIATLTASESVSGRLIFPVVQQVGDWVEVELPTGPPDRSGWVARDDVALSRHRFRIEVALGARTLTLYTGTVEALSTPIALGPDAPAAGDRLFITELVQPPDPAGAYGAYAYGLSGGTNDAAAFAAGRGVVAVHGVNDPAALGAEVAAGSIGVAPDIMSRMADTIGLPLGTPVDVVE